MYGNLFNLSSDVISKLGNRLEDRLEFARIYSAQMIISGDVEIKPKQGNTFEIGISLAAYQTLNKRLIAEVVRKFDTSPGYFDYVVPKKMESAFQLVFQDLSSQIFDTWQRGTLGSSVFKLTLKGKLPLLEQEAFKELVRSRALEIKNIRERKVTLASTEFEFDSTSSPKEISAKLNNMELGNFKFIVESTGDDFIQISSIKR
jgi:isochorismate synthase EntC